MSEEEVEEEARKGGEETFGEIEETLPALLSIEPSGGEQLGEVT